MSRSARDGERGVDSGTLRYYDDNAEEVAARYETVRDGVSRYFPLSFEPGARVLDLGSGTGRDLASLVAEGLAAYGIEPSAALRRVSVQLHPELAHRVLEGALPDELPTTPELSDPFDGVLCAAVLQHLPRSLLFDAIFSIRRLLRDRGRLLAAIPLDRSDVGADGRDRYGRVFNDVRPEELQLLVERAGFQCIGRWQDRDALGRGWQWVTLLFELQSRGTSRPLDRIEAVLTRDQKVATYKFALLRALANIATTQPHRVRWREDGSVGVPLDAVCERWILYYWPLQRAAIRQLWSGTPKFSQHLLSLIRHYERRGGFETYLADRRGGHLPDPAAERLHRNLVRAVNRTVIEGPVKYAGGALGSRLFRHESSEVVLEAALWRELSLMGHWIEDSLILRWAELTHDRSPEVDFEKVVRLLRAAPVPDRETEIARRVYRNLAALRCVWTDRPISDEFAVDHVLPFSLWHNNDLWNLLPAHPAVNSAKGDKLPDRRFLMSRKTAIVKLWEHARAALEVRFDREASALTGRTRPSNTELFRMVAESVEVTALQRGCLRWDGPAHRRGRSDLPRAASTG